MNNAQRLRALSDAATPGPWDQLRPDGEMVVRDRDGDTVAVCKGAWDGDAKADAAFIVAAVNYVRALLESSE